jgi:tol-pal system protein YbgF
MKAIIAILMAGLSLLFWGGCALQKDIYSLEERMLALENRNRMLEERNQTSQQNRAQLEKQLAGMGKDRQFEEQKLKTQYAGVNANIEALRQEIQEMRGRIEEMEYQIKRSQSSRQESEGKAKEQLTYLSEDLQKTKGRIVQLEQYLNMEKDKAGKAAAAAAASAGTAASATTAKKTAMDLYKSAKEAFDAGKNAEARKGFEKLIKEFPKSQHADNAQFWIGETYYKEKWYEKAILEYQKVMENYPKGNKVPAALLKQGLAFRKIGDTANARLILKELVNKYPQTSEGSIAKQKLKEF